ncbi:MAG: radical SAM protein [Thiohalomonadales bacterium]
MFSAIYFEQAIGNHPQTRHILDKFPKLPHIECMHYGEIFNRHNQNFRIQKRMPALILAQKKGKLVLPAPAEYNIGGQHNYYFSHMLNCIYDCRYCFLQGMYNSAHNVLFVNYADIQQSIHDTLLRHPDAPVYFFSGYDCDSLALEPISGFIENILPLFDQHPQAFLELRTKSTQIRHLLSVPALQNCIVAFSLADPQTIAEVEHKTPSLQKRLDALQKLQKHGWPIGLRFDPVIYQPDYEQRYSRLFKQVFSQLDVDTIHSVSLGSLRLPKTYFKKISALYPEQALFARQFDTKNKLVAYAEELSMPMHAFCESELLKYIPRSNYFPCF